MSIASSAEDVATPDLKSIRDVQGPTRGLFFIALFMAVTRISELIASQEFQRHPMKLHGSFSRAGCQTCLPVQIADDFLNSVPLSRRLVNTVTSTSASNATHKANCRACPHTVGDI